MGPQSQLFPMSHIIAKMTMPYIVFVPDRGVDRPGIGIYTPINIKVALNYTPTIQKSYLGAT